jgi:FSR family fosmidomycin resistance protein-like MFS transporter
MVNDMYSNLLAGLLPVLTVAFGLSYMLAGLVAMVFNVVSSVLQPLLGRWFDRTQTVWLLEAGLILNCFGMSLVGLSPSYVIILLLVGTAGLGTASFHPPAFSKVVNSAGQKKGGAMGLFIAGGNTGFFLGPLVAGAILTLYGLHGTVILLPIGLVAAAILLRARVTGGIRSESCRDDEPKPTADKPLLAVLAGITACRSTLITVVETFLPMYFVSRGASIFVAAALASLATFQIELAGA